jgi:hypothetical protein
MFLKKIIKNSVFCIIGTIVDELSVAKTSLFIEINKEVIAKFPSVHVHLNSVPSCKEIVIKSCVNLYRTAFPETLFIIDVQPNNRGHMFGTIDLDEACFNSTVNTKYDFLWKSTEDVIISESLIENIKVDLADFYYLPSISYEDILRKTGNNLINLPQTNFFIVNTKKINSLYGSVEDKITTYQNAVKLDSNIKPWDIQYSDCIKFDCEHLLQQTVSKLTQFNLLNQETISKLLRHVSINKVGDPSHKNIMFKEIGVCHYHFWRDKIYEI